MGVNDWWYQPCLDNIKALGGTMCPEEHCDATIVKQYSESYCNCSSTYPNGCSPNRYDGCCSYSATSPVPIISEGCYCCCGCFANETPVAVDVQTYKAIAEFVPGDLVYVADNADLSSWSQKQVLFSNGAGGNTSQITMIKLTYDTGDGKLDHLFVSRDQLFYMTDQKMKSAAKLVPDQDKLVYYDGTTALVKSLEVGKYKKGLHHIATSIGPATTLDGHLMLAKGIVCGDYALQLGLLAKDSGGLVADHDKLPEFGSQAYLEKYQHIIGDALKAHHPDYKPEDFDSSVFEKFGTKGAVNIPDSAQHFISREQALSIYENPNAVIAPVYSGIGDEVVKYLFTLFQGFYPDVNFYYDKENQMPNAYSFIEYGQTFVVVNGGLARISVMNFNLLAFVIGHELGHLYGGEPKNPAEYTCEGMSDYFAMTGVLPKVWYGLSAAPIMKAAISTLPDFFDLIAPILRKGRKGNTCMYISTDCRMDTVNAAFNMMALPACAGGPVDPKLQVSSALPVFDKRGTTLTVTYNLPVDPKSATAIGNYVFDPILSVNAARMDPKNPNVVNLSLIKGKPGGYSVCVFDVTSAKGEPLIKGDNCAGFNF
ncbi:M48 family metalloprotease [Chitinophaga sp.]|uniref:M48 family metalloprotease n=1 Tax=Chitinophaga sp. TaxID=1869181 RepID=UPI002F95A6D6